MKKTESQTILLVPQAGPIVRKNLLDHYWGEEVMTLPREINYRTGNGMDPDARTIYLDEGEGAKVNSYGYSKFIQAFTFGGAMGTAIYLEDAWFKEDGLLSSGNLMRLMSQLLMYIKDFALLEVIATSVDSEDPQVAFDKLADFFSFPRWPAPERRTIHGLIDGLDEHMEKAHQEGDIQANLDYAQKSPADELAPDPDPEPILPRTKKRPLTRAEAETWRKTRGQKTSEDEEPTDKESDA